MIDSKKKQQVDELATDIYSMLRSDTMSRAMASMLYDKGWKKQSENTPAADVAPRAEVAREIIAIIEQRLSNNANKRRNTESEFWWGIYQGREEAYKDIKEIIEQKYTEVDNE